MTPISSHRTPATSSTRVGLAAAAVALALIGGAVAPAQATAPGGDKGSQTGQTAKTAGSKRADEGKTSGKNKSQSKGKLGSKSKKDGKLTQATVVPVFDRNAEDYDIAAAFLSQALGGNAAYAGIPAAMTQAGGATVFVPNDGAFRDYAADVLGRVTTRADEAAVCATLQKLGPAQVTALFRGHIVPGAPLSWAALSASTGVELTTATPMFDGSLSTLLVDVDTETGEVWLLDTHIDTYDAEVFAASALPALKLPGNPGSVVAYGVDEVLSGAVDEDTYEEVSLDEDDGWEDGTLNDDALDPAAPRTRR